MVAEQAHDRPDSEKQKRWIGHQWWWRQMTMENLLAKKKKKPTKNQWNLSRRGKLAPPPEDQIGGKKLGPRSSTLPEQESGGGRSSYSTWMRLQGRWQRSK